MKKLTLTILASLTLIACIAQCDSAIKICPKLFDRLIKNDILAEQYKAYYTILLAETNEYAYVLEQKDLTINAKDSIISISNKELLLTNDVLDFTKFQLKQSERKNKFLKFGIFSIGILGCLSTGYFIFQ